MLMAENPENHFFFFFLTSGCLHLLMLHQRRQQQHTSIESKILALKMFPSFFFFFHLKQTPVGTSGIAGTWTQDSVAEAC